MNCYLYIKNIVVTGLVFTVIIAFSKLQNLMKISSLSMEQIYSVYIYIYIVFKSQVQSMFKSARIYLQLYTD